MLILYSHNVFCHGVLFCACLVLLLCLVFCSLLQSRVVSCALAPGWPGVVIVVLVEVVEVVVVVEVVEVVVVVMFTIVVVVPTNSRVEWHLDRAVSPRQMS